MPLVLTTALFAGIPLPETTVPAAGAAAAVTFVIVVLPLVTRAPQSFRVNATLVPVDVALADIVIWDPLSTLAT